MGSLSVRGKVLEGGLVSIGRYGLGRTTVDDVAQASGVSRATIYRHFPGGRDQLVRDTVAWEMGRFFAALGEAVAAAPDLCALLEIAADGTHAEVAAPEEKRRCALRYR